MMSAAYGVIDCISAQPFHILLFNVYKKAMHLLKQMMVEYATDPPSAMMTTRSSLNRLPPT